MSPSLIIAVDLTSR